MKAGLLGDTGDPKPRRQSHGTQTGLVATPGPGRRFEGSEYSLSELFRTGATTIVEARVTIHNWRWNV